MATASTIEQIQEPKKRKRRRLRIKKLNPFRKKYKKFSDDVTNNDIDKKLDDKKARKSRARDWLSTAIGVLTFRSQRRKRKRASSTPISSYRARRGTFGSTGSLECLVTRDFGSDNELSSKKPRKRAWSDPCLYQTSKDLAKKKKSRKKKVKKASLRACKFMGTGLVQVAGVWQFASPVAAVPAHVRYRPHEKPKATYYDDQRKRHRNYSNMMYAYM